MTDLFERVLHHIEGNETEIQNWETKTGIESYAVPSFGPDRWIERAAKGGLMAVDLLAVILFSVRETFNKEHERRIVDGWASELRKAVASGEIQARDPVTLLALGAMPDGWDWLVATNDADKFIHDRGMGWTCTETVAYLLEQTRKEGTKYIDPKTGALMKHYWLAGYEPKEPAPATDTATPAPVVAVKPASDAMPDPERRLALLRALGGDAKYSRGDWTFKGISALVASEKGRKRSTEKTIREDLKEAAQNERDAGRAGFATGLGQR